MRFICQQDQLLMGINTVQKAMAAKSTLSVLEGIYMETEGELLKLKCVDLALGIESYVPAIIEEEGVTVVPGRLFADIIRKLPEGQIQVIKDEQNTITIQSEHSRTTVQGMLAAEFPDMPAVESEQSVRLDQGMFKKMIRQSIFATAVDETKPILTGALIEIEDNTINLVALDGYRLAMRKEKLETAYPATQIVIPAKTLGETAKILGDEEGDVIINFEKTRAMISLGYTKVITRLLEGDFIKYRQILPADYQTRVKVNTALLSDSIDRASLLAREGKNNLIKFTIGGDKLVITSNAEVGSAYEEVPVYVEGKELEIAFNAKYFVDVLKNLEDEEVYLDFNSNVSPCVVRPCSGDSFLYLILPVRIYGA